MPHWIHERAKHILARNPSMSKDTAFAVATQQSHALGKSPKGYGTAEGKQEAKKKYDTPKDDKKTANPGSLESSKLSYVEGQQSDGSHWGANAAVAAAGASPFAGMIGQKPIIHDPLQGAKGAKFKTLKDLSRSAQTGDVLVLSTPSGSIFKNFATPESGTEFYHAQPVYGRNRKGFGLTEDTGGLYEGSTRYMREQASPVHHNLSNLGYDDAVLLRPKKPLTPDQLKKFQERALWRGSQRYDQGKAVSGWLRDMFVPKIPGLTDRGKQVTCQGNICSTAPAMATYEAGRRTPVVPGKRAQDVMPSDYLRSSEYELVGSHIPNARKYTKGSATLRAARPYLTRAGVGLGLAGATYAATHDQDSAGAVAGGAGAVLGANALAKATMGKEKSRVALPGVKQVINQFMREGSDQKALSKFVTRKVPLALAGAGAGYYGMKKLRQHFQPSNEKVAFTTSQYSGPLGGGPIKYTSQLPNKPPPPLKAEGEKIAFEVSEYSGDLGPAVGPKQHSQLPSFSRPSFKRPEKEKEAASVASPLARLTSSRRVGLPKLSVSGPSIAQQAKPNGFGLPLAGATK